MRRKEEGSKRGQTNKQGKAAQHTHACTHCTCIRSLMAVYRLAYQSLYTWLFSIIAIQFNYIYTYIYMYIGLCSVFSWDKSRALNSKTHTVHCVQHVHLHCGHQCVSCYRVCLISTNCCTNHVLCLLTFSLLPQQPMCGHLRADSEENHREGTRLAVDSERLREAIYSSD